MAVFGLGVFYGGVILGVPVVTGVAEGVHHQKKANEEANNSDRMIKFYIDCKCEADLPEAEELEGMILVVHKDRVCCASAFSFQYYLMQQLIRTGTNIITSDMVCSKRS
jgi:hypothetical protein